jgi:RNA recognition motif-containing protein
MSKKVFVGGLPWAADDSDLEAALSQFGEVEVAKVVLDKETEKSRGFGFVTFVNEDDARGACDTGVIDIEVAGRRRTCKIDMANERPRPQRQERRNDNKPSRGRRDNQRKRGKWDESDRGRRHKVYDDEFNGGGYNDGGGWSSH